ncbi:MAG TPA: polyprenyl synthetase family protein, partial [Ktedonobacteraceae bacterium]|nr:polyprenyl synthetase family protein [Ktedonobacteraceae bacterium]
GLANSIEENNNYLRCALPAAAALELTHNFTLIHDDIVDNDTERHHQPTLWSIWGTSQGINTGDGMFALARLTMWDILSEGVEGEVAAHLGAVLDRACLIVAEGQYLDLSFERRQDISVAMYLDMITRKTAALMSCATEMGAQLGTHDSTTIESLRKFGYEIGVAFQVRDDVLGVWASASETGKTSAGDIYRRKRSLPFLHALENAGEQDKHTLQKLYSQEIPLTAEQAAMVLDIFEYTHTRAYCIDFLRQKCSQARLAFERIPRLHNETAKRALDDLETIILFVEATIEL